MIASSNNVPFNDQLRKRIKSLRKEKKLNQEGVAAYLGVKRSTYTKFELGGVKEIKAVYLHKLCALYGISFEELTGSQHTLSGAASPEIEEYLRKTREVLESAHISSSALKSNIDAFHVAVNQEPTIKEMAATIESLKQAIHELVKDKDSDFKTSPHRGRRSSSG